MCLNMCVQVDFSWVSFLPGNGIKKFHWIYNNIIKQEYPLGIKWEYVTRPNTTAININ